MSHLKMVQKVLHVVLVLLWTMQPKDKVKGFIPKLVVQPEYGTVYQHQGMLLQNLYRHYLYIVIRLPKHKDLDQKIPMFPNCDNYGVCRSSKPNRTSDDVKRNDNALHQQICTHFKVDYLEEMNIIKQIIDGFFTTYYAFNRIVLDVLMEKFNIQVDEDTIT